MQFWCFMLLYLTPSYFADCESDMKVLIAQAAMVAQNFQTCFWQILTTCLYCIVTQLMRWVRPWFNSFFLGKKIWTLLFVSKTPFWSGVPLWQEDKLMHKNVASSSTFTLACALLRVCSDVIFSVQLTKIYQTCLSASPASWRMVGKMCICGCRWLKDQPPAVSAESSDWPVASQCFSPSWCSGKNNHNFTFPCPGLSYLVADVLYASWSNCTTRIGALFLWQCFHTFKINEYVSCPPPARSFLFC